MYYARFTYVSSTAGPTLRVIMARICVTRNTMANTGERQIREKDGEERPGEDAGGRARKKRREKKKEEEPWLGAAARAAAITHSAG